VLCVGSMMTDNKPATIKGMKRPALIALLEEAISNINEIEEAKSDAIGNKTKIEEISNEMQSKQDESIANADEYQGEITSKRDDINAFYKELVGEEGEGGADSLKGKIYKTRDKIENAKKEVCGNGTKKKRKGLVNEIKEVFIKSDQESKKRASGFNSWHEKIKNECGSLIESIEKIKENAEDTLNTATTASLAETFDTKAKQFSRVKFWWTASFVTLTVIIVLAYLSYLFYFVGKDNLLENEWKVLSMTLPLLPIFAMLIWFGGFTTNKVAENKKLQECYKHKEVMARSFVGYRKQLLELGQTEEYSDITLIEKHMNNLLEALSVDPSTFLSTRGEKSPVVLDTNKKPKNTPPQPTN